LPRTSSLEFKQLPLNQRLAKTITEEIE